MHVSHSNWKTRKQQIVLSNRTISVYAHEVAFSGARKCGIRTIGAWLTVVKQIACWFQVVSQCEPGSLIWPDAIVSVVVGMQQLRELNGNEELHYNLPQTCPMYLAFKFNY